MSYEDTLSEIERTLDKAGVGTQRPRLHNLGSIFPSQAERVEMLVEERDEARAEVERLRERLVDLLDLIEEDSEAQDTTTDLYVAVKAAREVWRETEAA